MSCEPCAVVSPPGVVAVPVLMFTAMPPGAIPRLSAVVRRTVLAAEPVNPPGAEPVGNGTDPGPIQSLLPVTPPARMSAGSSTPALTGRNAPLGAPPEVETG